MKIKIMIPIIGFLLMISLAKAAIYFPLPITGQVVTDNPEGLLIKITNMRTRITAETTIQGGYFLYDWANSDDDYGQITKYVSGDQFKV
jgi:hypothetical protein